jgi:uncharacterized PurR-regulated membrane protein YhhQ (DUF165 family)
MNKIFSQETKGVNNLYIALSAGVFVATLLLNISTKLVVCSVCFTAMTFLTNVIGELYGNKRALTSLLASLVVSFLLSWKRADFLLLGSFASVFAACYASLYIKVAGGFQVRNFLGLSVAALIDSFMMFATFTLLGSFTSAKIMDILFKDLMFKFSYISIIGVCVFLALKIADSRHSIQIK